MAKYCLISHARERLGDLVSARGGVVVLTRFRTRRAVVVSGSQYKTLTGHWPAPSVGYDKLEAQRELLRVVREARIVGEVALNHPKSGKPIGVVMSLPEYERIAGESPRCTEAYAPMPRLMAWRERRERVATVTGRATLILYWGLPAAFLPAAYLSSRLAGSPGLVVAWVLALVVFATLAGTWSSCSGDYLTPVIVCWAIASAAVSCGGVAVSLWMAQSAGWAPVLVLGAALLGGYVAFALFLPISTFFMFESHKW